MGKLCDEVLRILFDGLGEIYTLALLKPFDDNLGDLILIQGLANADQVFKDLHRFVRESVLDLEEFVVVLRLLQSLLDEKET